ncbi:MAG: phosphoribosylamine--glycine ligase [Oscillospiraceae bacterium]|jgi:phosphoribosylamine--glycine ligase|nr:phosphoribosylamine--glycine ligase [Oscillospiraceae bacterium]
MTVLVIGSGGREHAIAAALAKSPQTTKIYAIPGNGGIAQFAECVPGIKATELEKIRDFAAANRVDFAVPAADDPLCLGAVDLLEAAGIPCFGPDKAAARIEGSKVFSKNLMRKYNIPTARYESFQDAAAALAYLDTYDTFPVVIKADGLALGKGVIIAPDRGEARRAVRELMEEGKFGASGSSIVIEEFLTGPEVTVLSFTDGTSVVPMVASTDHKRALDGDRGLNTGGMGTIAPSPYYTPEIAARCMEEIFRPTVRAMAQEGTPFRGCLYFGLMLTPDGPKVIEYNCRFGDPETQVVLPLLETDLLEIFRAVREGRLAETPIRWKDAHACCVVLASGGYPEKYETGFPIDFGGADGLAGVRVYHAGTKQLAEGTIVTAGGRVLGVTALSGTLAGAVAAAYAAADRITFPKAYCRRDIGRQALEYLKKEEN